MDVKTQAATEYLMVVGFVLVILIPGIYLYVTYSAESQDSIINAKVDAVANEIVKATDQVYSYGEGSQTKLTINLPDSIKLIEFINNEIIFTVVNSKGAESEIAKVANVNLQGEITLIPGTKTINIQSFGDSVGVYVECGSGDRCGTEWECSYYDSGDECIMECVNNQWDPGRYCADCIEGECSDQQQFVDSCEGTEDPVCSDNCERENTPCLKTCIDFLWIENGCEIGEECIGGVCEVGLPM